MDATSWSRRCELASLMGRCISHHLLSRGVTTSATAAERQQRLIALMAARVSLICAAPSGGPTADARRRVAHPTSRRFLHSFNIYINSCLEWRVCCRASFACARRSMPSEIFPSTFSVEPPAGHPPYSGTAYLIRWALSQHIDDRRYWLQYTEWEPFACSVCLGCVGAWA